MRQELVVGRNLDQSRPADDNWHDMVSVSGGGGGGALASPAGIVVLLVVIVLAGLIYWLFNR